MVNKFHQLKYSGYAVSALTIAEMASLFICQDKWLIITWMTLFAFIDAVKISALVRIMPLYSVAYEFLFEALIMLIYLSYLAAPTSIQGPCLAMLAFAVSLKVFLILKIFKEYRIFLEMLNSVVPDMRYFVVVQFGIMFSFTTGNYFLHLKSDSPITFY